MMLVDTHVHLHPCYDTARFLAAAAGNFRVAAQRLSAGGACTAVLCLTEDAGADAFSGLAGHADTGQRLDGWSVARGSEPCTLWLEHAGYGQLVLLAGRQIRCAGGLEVLALGTRRRFRDGLALDQAIEQARLDAAAVVMPWGFGKWTGRRGRLVRETLEREAANGIYLGDNSGRPAFWPEPAEFARARQLGVRILPGSDPLPFASEVGRAGGFGLALSATTADQAVARQLSALLADPAAGLTPYGRGETPWRFLRNQLAMQLVKRRMRVRAA